MTKTFDELDARVTLLGEEVARLGHRDGTVRGQIEDLQGRVNAATENIQELITKPCPPAPVRFERPCFGGIYPDEDVSDCNKGSGCGGPDWEDCGYGGKSPHLAEYREPATKEAEERAKKAEAALEHSRAAAQECDSAIGELNEARRVREIWRERAEKAEKVLLDPTAFVQRSEYEYALQEKGQWRKQAQWAKDSTENALLRAAKAEARCKELEICDHHNQFERETRADERERVAKNCEYRGFVETARVIRAMGDKVKP